MKITKIIFENFRNFKDRGEIRCSTDGKVTIIYGKNGDGKTTLHQLFQWVFYGKVNFNKTTTDRLYNLKYESECSYGQTFPVMGCIDFEHENKKYSLTRMYIYRKDLVTTEKISEEIDLQYMDENYNWRTFENPKEIIEKLLPSGLAEYFFFDGESMIADLRLKGKDSARNLKKALFSMFDLDILDSAIRHLGRTDLRSTVLGKLYLNKGYDKNQKPLNTQVAEEGQLIKNTDLKLDELEEKLKKLKREKKELSDFIIKISEEIGTNKSKKEYESQRKEFKNTRDQFYKSAENELGRFGDAINEIVPQILISKAISNAKLKLRLNIEKNKLPSGISHKLINYLLDNSTTHCICGHELGDNERKQIESYLNLLPPKSYTNIYQDFTKTTLNWGEHFDKDRIENCIKDYLRNTELVSDYDKRIMELDEDKKKELDIEELIIKRQEAEKQILENLEPSITLLETDKKKYEILRNKHMKKYDQLTQDCEESQKTQEKIFIMEQILEYFQNKLANESNKYSQKLQENIQNLINKMLTSKRTVNVTPEFSVQIKDSYNDESKSEGQFAVVSFAYIGGILNLLQHEESFSEKEYPLVLDGPFSKLDPEQRQNVVNTIPEFAPQVIIFSKDDLRNIFKSEHIGKVWTITSNDEKNIATVKEGYLWN